MNVNDEKPASNANLIPLPDPPAAPAPPAPGAKFRYRRDTQAVCPATFISGITDVATTAPPASTPFCEHRDQTVRQLFLPYPSDFIRDQGPW